MKTIKTLFVLLLAGILSACAPTPTARSTGEVLDDASLTARVKTQIAQSTSLAQAAAVNVDSYRGAVALSGFVDDEQQKRDVGKAAMSVAGVEKVFNNLELKPQASGR